MADPEMTLSMGDGGGVYPLTYINHFVMDRRTGSNIYQVAAEALSADGSSWRTNAVLQKQLADFANDWIKNIKEQQHI